MKKRLVLFVILMLLTTICGACRAGENDKFSQPIELVESVPVESIFGSPDVRTPGEVWIDMINEAKKTLNIETFYICNEKGEPMEPIIDAIKEAGKRGVKVRIISDSKFYVTYPETLDELNKVSNISVKIINIIKITDGVMHAKYFVVDGEDLFLGSQNFDWKALKHIHEIGIRIRDKRLAETVEKIFDLDWFICEAKDPAEYQKKLQEAQDVLNAQKPITINNNGEEIILYPSFSPKDLIYKDMTWEETAIVSLIDNAKEEVMVQVLQYSPEERKKTFYPALDNALRAAAIRGVSVKMIISDWAMKKPAVDFIKSLSLVPGVEIKFSTIPEWSGGFVSFARVEHCKYMVVDGDMSWIGTGNWEKGYFYACRNLGVVLKSKNINTQLRNIFDKDWAGPYTEKVDPMKEYKAPKVSD